MARNAETGVWLSDVSLRFSKGTKAATPADMALQTLQKERPGSNGLNKRKRTERPLLCRGGHGYPQLCFELSLSFVLSILWSLVWFVLRDLISTSFWILIVAWLLLSVRFAASSPARWPSCATLAMG